jgi:hypothetical protein
MDYAGFFRKRLDALRAEGRHRVFADPARLLARHPPAAQAHVVLIGDPVLCKAVCGELLHCHRIYVQPIWSERSRSSGRNSICGGPRSERAAQSARQLL